MMILLRKNKVFINMKTLLFFLVSIIFLSGCYVERRSFVHHHSWNRTNRVHRYYVPRPYSNRFNVGPSKW